MTKPGITALLIEDNPDDALLIQRYLKTSGNTHYNIVHVGSLADGLECLQRLLFDVILLDLGLPDAPTGIGTFESVYVGAADVPIIVLSGNNDEDLAVEAVKKGAQDYMNKDQINGPLLGRAIRYAIERKKLLIQLEHSMKEITQLRGYLPICSNCKKIRDDKGYWTKLEVYISSHSNAEFSHGICPDCAQKLYPQVFRDDSGKE